MPDVALRGNGSWPGHRNTVGASRCKYGIPDEVDKSAVYPMDLGLCIQTKMEHVSVLWGGLPT
jgi:hypothetical protein